MSQISNLGSGGPVPPPAGVFTLTGNIDVGGGGPTPVPPDGLGNINIVGDNEITRVLDNAATNTLTIVNPNSSTDTATTVGFVPDFLLALDLGATPGVYEIEARIAAFDNATPSGAGWKIFATVRTDGATATLIGVNNSIFFAEPAINTASAVAGVNVSGANSFDILIFGVAGLTINWKSTSFWTFVS